MLGWSPLVLALVCIATWPLSISAVPSSDHQRLLSIPANLHLDYPPQSKVSVQSSSSSFFTSTGSHDEDDGHASISDIRLCPNPSPDNAFELHSLTLTPDPPQRGHNLTVHATGVLHRTIDRPANVHVVVKLGRFIQLLERNFSLCDEAPKVNQHCPLQKGNIDINSSFELPKDIPPGTYFITAKVTDQNGGPVTCIQANVHFT